MSQIREDDPFKNARLTEIENAKQTSMDGLKCFIEKEKKSKKGKLRR